MSVFMYRLLLAIFCASLAKPLVASDFGVKGLIDIPTARMSADGTLTTTAAIQSRTNSYSITYQATPWLEGTFRYTGFNEFFHYDRNYEAKVRLLPEQKYLPQLALGIRDLVGTGVYGSEYLVASKKYGNFDVTAGMGWGRLAGKGDFNNPLIHLSDSFEVRDGFEGLVVNFPLECFLVGKRRVFLEVKLSARVFAFVRNVGIQP